MPDKIHLTVATVVPRNGKYLIVEELDKISGKRVFNQPAGHVEPGETIIQAAHRETLEETGWRISLTGFLGAYSYLAPNQVLYHRMAFIARPMEFDESARLDPDILATHWLSSTEMRNNAEKMRSPMVLKTIDYYEKGTIYPLEIFQ